MSATLRLCLVRHGETDWNRQHRLQGWTDVPLNARGLAQATACARELGPERFAAVYCSDLRRARQTAERLAAPHGLPLLEEPRLRERHLGALQGLRRDEIAGLHPELHALMVERRPHYRPPGGERLETFLARVRAWLDELPARHPGQTLLAVSHGGVLDLVHRLASGQDLQSPRAIALPNAALNWFVWRGQRWWVEASGRDAHLSELSLDDQGG